MRLQRKHRVWITIIFSIEIILLFVVLNPQYVSDFFGNEPITTDQSDLIIINGNIATNNESIFPKTLIFQIENALVNPNIVEDFKKRYTQLCVTDIRGSVKIDFRDYSSLVSFSRQNDWQPSCRPDSDLYLSENEYISFPLTSVLDRIDTPVKLESFYMYPFDNFIFLFRSHKHHNDKLHRFWRII